MMPVSSVTPLVFKTLPSDAKRDGPRYPCHNRLPSPDPVIRKSEFAKLIPAVDVPAVENNRRFHQFFHLQEVGGAELVPLRHDGQGVGPLERVVPVISEKDPVLEYLPRLRGRDGIVGPDLRPRPQE